MRFEKLKKDLIRLEGFRNKPYKCTANKLTIGVGRNLEDKGISGLEADFLLDNDIADCYNDLRIKLPFFMQLDDNRQDVLMNMAFQLGIDGLLKFRKTLKLIEKGEYSMASIEMLDSVWAKQTEKRALEMALKMKEGK